MYRKQSVSPWQSRISRHRWRGLISVVALVCVPVSAAMAQRQTVTRADLAMALLEFESAMISADLDEDLKELIHRQFDHAAALFFSGRNDQAVRRIHELTDLVAGDDPEPAAAWLRSRTLDPVPRVIGQDRVEPVSLTIRALYDAGPPSAEWGPLRVRLFSPGGEVVWRERVELAYDDPIGVSKTNIDLPWAVLPEGRFDLELSLEQTGSRVRWQPIYLVPGSIQIWRDSFNSKLAAIAEDQPDLQEATRVLAAIAGLLRPVPSPVDSAQFLADPLSLIAALRADVASLEAGVNPLIGRSGDFWRVIHHRGRAWPMRLFVPSDAFDSGPAPVMIALHGAGGDESMFSMSYGAGRAKALAAQHGFILVSPLTYPLSADIELFDRLLDELNRCYAVDNDRVYLIGHSLGAHVVTACVNLRPNRIAAAVCIAGAGRFVSPHDEADTSMPPALLYGAEFDSIIPARRIEREAIAASTKGLPVTYRLAPRTGHVLIVAEVLGEAVEWLLERRRRSGAEIE